MTHRLQITTDFRALSRARAERRLRRRQRRVLDDDPAPGCSLLGARQAFAEGFEVVTLPPTATERQWAAFRDALAHHAIVVDVAVERNGRRWSLGVPPPGFSEARLEELARRAGMCGLDPITFRWVPLRGPRCTAPIQWSWNSSLRDC